MQFHEAIQIIKDYDQAAESGEGNDNLVKAALEALSQITGIPEGDLAEDCGLTGYPNAEVLISEYRDLGIIK